MSAPFGFTDAARAAAFIHGGLKHPPKVGVILGTGLGSVISDFKIESTFDYGDIPYFPLSTVVSHQGRLYSGSWSGCPVLVFQGRVHLYEGYSAREVTFPIRVCQALGVQSLILTNASGGLNPRYHSGDIMIIKDHLNLTGENPLVGANDERWGPRFPGMTQAYSRQWADWAREAAAADGWNPPDGIYAGLKGPSLETPAEMRYLRTIGADAVGFSTVMEAIAAVQAGMDLLGLSTITNMCLPDTPCETSVEEIIATAENAAPRLSTLISGVLKKRMAMDG